MAEKHSVNGQDGCGSAAAPDSETNDLVNPVNQTSKRCSSTSPSSVPPHKSPRTDFPSPTMQTSDAAEGPSETGEQETQSENIERPTSPSIGPTARRKSWRRATITRRSLPALTNPYQLLCRDISTSLPQQERLEKLMEASMRLAIDRLQSLLQSVPNSSQETFQKQVENMQKDWGSLAKSIASEQQSHQHPVSAARSSEPALHSAMEKIQKTIKKLQAESESWEALLNKHRSKAEELERQLAQGQKRVVPLDSASMAQSSQYLFIQNKPNYQDVLHRQQPMLHTMAMLMDTQSKIVRELLSIKEQSQLLVKETSGRLAAEAGFQDLSPDVLKNLLKAPLSSATI